MPAGQHPPTVQGVSVGSGHALQVLVCESQKEPSSQQMLPHRRFTGQHSVPPRHVSLMPQHLSPHGGWAKPQHKLSEAIQPLNNSSQQALPQALVGSQHRPSPMQISPLGQHLSSHAPTPSPRQLSPLGQHLSPHGSMPEGQHKLTSAMQESVGSQHVLPQMNSGWQQVPALGPVSMQVSVLAQQLSPTQVVLPGLQHSPISKFRQVSSTSQQATSPQPTGQQGAPVMLQAPKQAV